ncbi:hypothetical protein C2I18_28720 [Paenibacillus sp. PK3_47]|uniref:hypothetical protein n=1 Tax=Paenibacillus sp. PK3_47 TaxID=2072642 RepID=UPI00201E5CE3|nr:hypothetical protein [Paenibacillus sp. PK3_47]UQZ37171.1 hypothetical protein C2I18_28720 [Paenibacillus sp. PK3_47]
MFWVIAVVIVGVIGWSVGGEDTADQAEPAATEQAQPDVSATEAPDQPAAEPASTEAPAASPSADSAPSGAPSIHWESAIKQIAQSDTEATQKADAVEILARDYQPSAEEMSDFQSQIVEEFTAQNYLSQVEDAEYMLTNIFKAVVVERANEGTPAGDFAFDFYQNSKYVLRGADTPDSEAVKSNEEQMQAALDKMK